MQRRILISGSSGQLGSELKSISSDYNNYEFIFKNRNGLDLTDNDNIKRLFENNKYDFFINAAAYTAVDKAENDQELCNVINSNALKLIAQYCNPECQIIHISSDYVYNNNPGRPLVETDQTNALGTYALSKLNGEHKLLNERADSIIIRTSWVYSEYGHNFVKTMLRLGVIKDNLTIVNDQIGTPTYAKELAKCLMSIIQNIDSRKSKSDLGGIYNFSHNGTTTWADFARTVFKIKKIDCTVNHTTTELYNAAAHRPLWSVLSMSKIEKTFGIKIKDWKDCLKDCLSRLT